MLDENEVKCKAELAKGKTPREASEITGVHYTTALKYHKQLLKKAEDDKVKKVTALDPVALQVVVDNIEASDSDIDISSGAKSIVEGARGLALLEAKFQSTVTKLLEKTEEVLDGDNIKVSDIKTLSGSVGQLYSDIYSNKGTQVQINNNNVSGDKLDTFKGSQR